MAAACNGITISAIVIGGLFNLLVWRRGQCPVPSPCVEHVVWGEFSEWWDTYTPHTHIHRCLGRRGRNYTPYTLPYTEEGRGYGDMWEICKLMWEAVQQSPSQSLSERHVERGRLFSHSANMSGTCCLPVSVTAGVKHCCQTANTAFWYSVLFVSPHSVVHGVPYSTGIPPGCS